MYKSSLIESAYAICVALAVVAILSMPETLHASAQAGFERSTGIPLKSSLDLEPIESNRASPIDSQDEGYSESSMRRTIQLAQNRDRKQKSRPDTGPPPIEVRGHEQKIDVIRRSARPIPRISNSTKRRRNRDRYGSYSSSHHYYNGYHHGHVHHAHCGHHYWGYGDAFESRTLGRSCIYGPKGEVIYKPADVICAPEEEPTVPASAPGPNRVASPSRPQPREEAK